MRALFAVVSFVLLSTGVVAREEAQDVVRDAYLFSNCANLAWISGRPGYLELADVGLQLTLRYIEIEREVPRTFSIPFSYSAGHFAAIHVGRLHFMWERDLSDLLQSKQVLPMAMITINADAWLAERRQVASEEYDARNCSALLR